MVGDLGCLKVSLENGGLLEYFFGTDGKACLQYGRFFQFLRDLHDEVRASSPLSYIVLALLCCGFFDILFVIDTVTKSCKSIEILFGLYYSEIWHILLHLSVFWYLIGHQLGMLVIIYRLIQNMRLKNGLQNPHGVQQ